MFHIIWSCFCPPFRAFEEGRHWGVPCSVSHICGQYGDAGDTVSLGQPSLHDGIVTQEEWNMMQYVVCASITIMWSSREYSSLPGSSPSWISFVWYKTDVLPQGYGVPLFLFIFPFLQNTAPGLLLFLHLQSSPSCCFKHFSHAFFSFGWTF